MTDALKAHLTAAFEFFGPERVTRAMRVFDIPDNNHWPERAHLSVCFVGLMVNGRPGDFSRMCNMSYVHAYALSGAYEEGNRESLRALAAEWLESACVPQLKAVPA